MTHPLVRKHLSKSEAEINEFIASNFNFEKYHDVLLEVPKIHINDVISTKISGFDKDRVYCDMGHKSNGYIPISEFKSFQIADLEIGSEVRALVDHYDEDTNYVVLSRRKAERIESWQNIVNKHREGSEVSGRVIKELRNGLLVDIGVIAFLPISQISDRRFEGSLSEYLGNDYDFEILKIDHEKENIIVSRKKLIEKNKKHVRKAIIESINVGDIAEGIVKNITNYGAFIDLGGLDGLLHITDISWNRISHPKDILRKGQKLNVKILNIDNEKGRISLGIKQLKPNPWREAEKKYTVGAELNATITQVNSDEALIELDSGVESNVPIDSLDQPIEVGNQIKVKVNAINAKQRRIDLQPIS